MNRRRIPYDEIALVGYGIALLIAAYFVFFQKSDDHSLSDEQNLIGLIEIAEKEGRWSDAAMLRRQMDKLQAAVQSTDKTANQLAPQTSEGDLRPLNPSDKISDWKQASDIKRLALCAGIAEVANRSNTVKYSAQDYFNCIEEATRGLSQADELIIFDVARACDAIMRGKPEKSN